MYKVAKFYANFYIIEASFGTFPLSSCYKSEHHALIIVLRNVCPITILSKNWTKKELKEWPNSLIVSLSRNEWHNST